MALSDGNAGKAENAGGAGACADLAGVAGLDWQVKRKAGTAGDSSTDQYKL